VAVQKKKKFALLERRPRACLGEGVFNALKGGRGGSQRRRKIVKRGGKKSYRRTQIPQRPQFKKKPRPRRKRNGGGSGRKKKRDVIASFLKDPMKKGNRPLVKKRLKILKINRFTANRGECQKKKRKRRSRGSQLKGGRPAKTREVRKKKKEPEKGKGVGEGHKGGKGVFHYAGRKGRKEV